MTFNTTQEFSARLAIGGRRHFVVLGSLLVGFYASAAAAQGEPTAADTAAARELAIEGLKLAEAGHCAQAIDKLFRAEKLRHSPIVLGRLGECQIEEGKVVDGTEDLQRLLHEPLPANPSASLVRARERAQTALDAAKSKIASLTISVRGAPENVTVTVDGQAVPALLLDRDRPTDAGEHVVEASAPGYIKSTRHVTLAAGEKQEVALKLRVDPTAKATMLPNAAEKSNAPSPMPKSTASVAATSESKPAKESTPNHTASTILWIAGGAVAAAGGVFGYLALSDKRTLDSQCVNNSCPTGSQGTLDSANRYATVSTILVSAGATGLALGTVLYFTAGSNSSAEPPPPTGFHSRAFVGLNRVGIEGTF